MTRAAAVLPTRFGPLLIVIDDAATGDRSAPVPGAVVGSGLQHGAGPVPLQDPAGRPLLAYVADAVAAWDSGRELGALDRVPVMLEGEGFRAAALRALRTVPPGETVSYRELAALAGNGRAARAAGTACASNPFAPFVPCHRVVLSSGRLGEYGYGSARKRSMLQHEGAIP